jgi:hypothetical protein
MEAKRKSVPSPCQYNPVQVKHILLGNSDKQEKRPAFIDNALSTSMFVPASTKYDELKAWKKVHRSSFALKIKAPSKIFARKDKSPEVGTYFKE